MPVVGHEHSYYMECGGKVKVKNELDNGWNNYVYDKKTKVLNPLLDTFVSTALEEGVVAVGIMDFAENSKGRKKNNAERDELFTLG